MNVAIDARSAAAVEVSMAAEDDSVAPIDAGGDAADAASASSLILESTRMTPSMRSAIVDCWLDICVVDELPAEAGSGGVCRCI